MFLTAAKGTRVYRPTRAREAHAETAKCWWLLKIERNAWAGGKGSCAVCVDLQAVGTLEFFDELYSLAKASKGFGPFLRRFGRALEKGRVTTSTSLSLQVYAELHALSHKPLIGNNGAHQ